jgi:hypothetical protein
MKVTRDLMALVQEGIDFLYAIEFFKPLFTIKIVGLSGNPLATSCPSSNTTKG